jgi:hypothetical protein
LTTKRIDLMRCALTIAEASARSGIAYSRLWRHVSTGQLLDADESARLQHVLDEARKRFDGAVTA